VAIIPIFVGGARVIASCERRALRETARWIAETLTAFLHRIFTHTPGARADYYTPCRVRLARFSMEIGLSPPSFLASFVGGVSRRGPPAILAGMLAA